MLHKKEMKYDPRNTDKIQSIMYDWRKASGLKDTDTFKYIIRKEYGNEESCYVEIITNRPGYIIGPAGARIKSYANQLLSENISRVDVLDTYKIHTVFSDEGTTEDKE